MSLGQVERCPRGSSCEDIMGVSCPYPECTSAMTVTTRFPGGLAGLLGPLWDSSHPFYSRLPHQPSPVSPQNCTLGTGGSPPGLRINCGQRAPLCQPALNWGVNVTTTPGSGPLSLLCLEVGVGPAHVNSPSTYKTGRGNTAAQVELEWCLAGTGLPGPLWVIFESRWERVRDVWADTTIAQCKDAVIA